MEWRRFVTYLWNDPGRLAMVWSQTMPMSYFPSEPHSSWNTLSQLQHIIIIINSWLNVHRSLVTTVCRPVPS